MKKLHVLFVATVVSGTGGATGGQAVAATALLESGLAQSVDLELLSTAPPEVPPPAMARRTVRALTRLSRFIVRLWAADVVLVFAADAISLLEKGWMCLLARVARRGVVLRISGGNLPAQCDGQLLLRVWLGLVLRSAHFVCAQSTHWTAYFARYTKREKVVHVSNGLKIAATPPTHPARARLVFVGWATREKGVFETVEVLARVRLSHPSATLTIVGGGRDLVAVMSDVSVRELTDAVHSTGWLAYDQVQQVLGESDVFLFPSHFEGLPNAVIEAMAAGLPIVATRVGGIPDVIRHGCNGYLVEVGDVADMVDRVNALLERPDLAQEMGQRGRQTALECCDIESVWPRYARAIREAAALTGRSPVTEQSGEQR